MAKPISKKIKKQAKSAAKSVGKSVDKFKKDGASKAAIAGAAALGAAGVAAAALHFLRRGPRGAAIFHVAPDEEAGWTLKAEGSREPLEAFRTKGSAVRAARKVAADAAPSELVIHGRDGAVLKSHSYDAL